MTAPKVFDRQTNKWMLVPDHEVTRGVADGRYAFESGIDVPVVAADGTLGSVPSEQIEEAFKNQGFRWATADDNQAFQQRQQEAIQEKNFGDSPLLAAGVGLANGALPGANYAMEGLGALAGRGEDVKNALIQTEARNPVANFAGEIAGAIASPITGGLANAARGVGERVAANALQGTARGIVAKMAPKAVGSALEGAYFGLHDAVNESALGDPGEIAETLMAGAGQGLIFGGITGAGFEAAKMGATPLKRLFSGAVDSLGNISEKALQAGTKGAVLPTLPAELRGEASAAIGDKATRDLYFFGGGKDAVKRVEGELASTEAEVLKQSKILKQELNNTIKGAPKELQAAVNESVDAAGGDLFAASKNLFADHQGQKLALEGSLSQAQGPGHIFSAIDHDTDRLIKKLEKYGDSFAKQKAGEIDNFINAQKASVGLPRHYDDASAYDMLMKSGHEVQVAQELRERALSGMTKLPERAQKMVNDYVDSLSYSLYEHPEFGTAIRAMDDKYAALDKLRGFVSEKTGGFTGSIAGKLKGDPEYATEFDALMRVFPDVAPDLQAFRSKISDVAGQQAHLDNIRQAIRDAGVKTYGRMGADDFAEIAKAMGRDDLTSKANTLRNLQESLTAQQVGPFSKYAAYLRALGKDVPESVMKYEGDQHSLMRLQNLMSGSNDSSHIEKILQKSGHGILKSALMQGAGVALGGLVGNSVIDGPAGYIAGALASGLVGKSLNPAKSLETLTRLERAVNKSYKTLNTATQAAVDALTGKVAKETAIKGVVFSNNIDERKNSFKHRSDYLTQLQDPDFRANEATNKIGNAEGAPNITAAMHGQFSRGANFLASKAPVDPMAHQSIMATKTPWKPSDMELAKYERYADTVENPMVALANITRGRVSPEEIETLQTVYPALYKGLQDRVLDAIMEPDLKLSYQQRVQIGTIFGLPADVSLRPNFIASMQQRFQNEPAKGPQPSGPSSSATPSSQANSTDVERITYK